MASSHYEMSDAIVDRIFYPGIGPPYLQSCIAYNKSIHQQEMLRKEQKAIELEAFLNDDEWFKQTEILNKQDRDSHDFFPHFVEDPVFVAQMKELAEERDRNDAVQSRIKQRELDIYIEKCYQATYKAKAQEERSIRHVEKKQHAEVRRKKERRRTFFKGPDTSGGGGRDSIA